MPVVTILAIVTFILVSAAIYLQFGGPKQKYFDKASYLQKAAVREEVEVDMKDNKVD